MTILPFRTHCWTPTFCRFSLVDQELFTLRTHDFTPVFLWSSCCSYFSFLCSILLIIVCLFVLLLSLHLRLLIFPLLISANLWSLYCLSFFDWRFLIIPLVSSKFGHSIVFHSSIYSFWYYLFGIIKPLIIVLSVLLRFTAWLPLWYRQTFDHCIVCPS